MQPCAEYLASAAQHLHVSDGQPVILGEGFGGQALAAEPVRVQ